MDNPAMRLCSTAEFPGALEIQNRKAPAFTGSFAYLTEGFLEFTRKSLNGNIIIEGPFSLGDPIGNGYYDGCLGRLQNNESDLLFYPADYPLEGNFLDQGLILYDNIIVFGQDYYVRQPSKDGQIFDSIQTVYDILPYIFLFLISVNVLLYLRDFMVYKLSIKTKKRNKFENKYHIFYTIAHATRYGSLINATDSFSRMIYFSLSVFSLVIIHYYSSSIKTSLVVINEPELWTSYQELIDKDIKPYFIEGVQTENYFKNAPENSSARILWDKWAKYGDKIYLKADPLVFSAFSVGLIYRKVALITESALIKLLQLSGCGFLKYQLEKIMEVELNRNNYTTNIVDDRVKRYLFTHNIDSSEKRRQKALILGGKFNPKISKPFKRHFRYTIENGIQISLLKSIQSVDIFKKYQGQFSIFTKRTDPGVEEAVENCNSDVVYRPTVEFVDHIEPKNLIRLFVVFSSLVVFSHLILLIEKIHRDFAKFRK